MSPKPLLRFAAAFALPVLVGACTQENTADQQAQQEAAAITNVALGVDRLLLFPNPIGTDPFAQNGGTFETDTSDYAAAYYAAIDPNNAEDTIDKWRKVNGFTGFANPVRPGTEHLAVFRDTRDLGYGRRMTGRYNSDDGSIAFYVENYNVEPGGLPSYASTLNVDAAIQRDTQWHVGTNAIEWTTTPCVPGYDPPDCNGTVKFAKYYNFSSKDGTRQLAVDLDGHGLKAMPGPCITCHGGRGDPLTPPDVSGKPRFPLVENSLSRKRGDVEAHLHGQNVDSFSFSTDLPGFAKSDMQPLLKDFNQWILCTYPTPAAASVTGAWGTCNRPIAGANEWQGTAGPMIEAWYGGPGMPAAIFNDVYQPAGWTTNTQIPGTTFTDTQLYQTVVVPYCRTCHILRGTANQSDLNFDTLGTPAVGAIPATGFRSYADRIKVHVFDRGNMPLALIPHSDFWNSTAPQMLASFIDSQLGAGTATANGAPLMPGRPIADPGPNRMVRTNANAVLTGENSLFASSFAWSEPTPSGHVNISTPNGMVAIFNADAAGSYVVRLTVNNGANFKDVTITVDDNFPDPLNIKFAQVKNVLQNVQHGVALKRCTDCHLNVAVPAETITPLVPPIWFTSFDRNGDTAINTTDDDWFLKALAGRVNLTEIEASALLRKPTGNHHGGRKVIDVSDTSSSGGLRNYSILYNWVLAGMQPGGVAANPLISTPQTLTFGGSPLFSTPIPVDGSTSVDATNFLWSVISPPGSGAVFADPAAATTTLSVPTTGTYVVQLHVDDGITSDAFQRTVVVNETPITANFSPLTGNVFVTFPPGIGSGNVTLTSTSTYGTGIPVNCEWVITSVPAGGAGTTLDGQTTLDVTKPCATPATLKVPLGAVGGAYGVQLIASTIGSNTTPVHTLTISNSAPTASLANTSASQALQFGQIATTTIPTHNTNTGGAPAGTATISVVAATASLNGSASTTPVGSLSYSWCLTGQPDQTNFPASVAVCPSQTSSGTTATLNMTVRATGQYFVQLTVDNGSGTSTTSKTVTVSPSRGVSFPTVVGVVGNTPCSGCHIFGTPLTGIFNPASGTNSGAAIPPWDNAATGGDGVTLYQRIMQRVNVASPAASLLVVCPNAGCDGGVMPGGQTGFTTTSDTNYLNFLHWIQDGAPPGN